MSTFADKIKTSLNETRMLMLGTQVLISLQFESTFEGRFTDLPVPDRNLICVALAMLLVTFSILLWGPAYHRLVYDGASNKDVDQFMTRGIVLALTPIGLAVAIDLFIAVHKIVGLKAGIGAAALSLALAGTLWYLLGAVATRSLRPPPTKEDKPPDHTERPPLHERVDQVLTEARVVLPGAQAMLGFQFVTLFMEAFDRLPASSRYVHLCALGMIAITVMLLMTPAAFHRVAEGGEDSERLVRISSVAVVTAMAPLALGTSLDFFVVVRKVTGSLLIGALCATAALAMFLGLWFGYTLFKRRKLRRHGRIGPLKG